MDLRQLSTVTSKFWFLLLPDSHLTLCLVGVAAVLLLLNRNLFSTGRRLSSYYSFSWLSHFTPKIPSYLVFTKNALRKHSNTCNSLAHTVNSIYTLPGKWYTFYFVASQPRNNFRTLKVFPFWITQIGALCGHFCACPAVVPKIAMNCITHIAINWIVDPDCQHITQFIGSMLRVSCRSRFRSRWSLTTGQSSSSVVAR